MAKKIRDRLLAELKSLEEELVSGRKSFEELDRLNRMRSEIYRKLRKLQDVSVLTSIGVGNSLTIGKNFDIALQAVKKEVLKGSLSYKDAAYKLAKNFQRTPIRKLLLLTDRSGRQ